MQLLTSNRTKRGYYIRRVKDSLWSVFGINRIKPFEDSYNKMQMKEWKQSKLTKTAHDDLYEKVDADDADSDTYLALIIKSVFTVKKERTTENAVWVQSVLETIFDEKHLSPKIESEVVESWTETLTDTEMVNI
jgi:hypothetical protein